jgi:hypothetical protein
MSGTKSLSNRRPKIRCFRNRYSETRHYFRRPDFKTADLPGLPKAKIDWIPLAPGAVRRLKVRPWR